MLQRLIRRGGSESEFGEYHSQIAAVWILGIQKHLERRQGR
jgi:hypothetical protein